MQTTFYQQTWWPCVIRYGGKTVVRRAKVRGRLSHNNSAMVCPFSYDPVNNVSIVDEHLPSKFELRTNLEGKIKRSNYNISVVSKRDRTNLPLDNSNSEFKNSLRTNSRRKIHPDNS